MEIFAKEIVRLHGVSKSIELSRTLVYELILERIVSFTGHCIEDKFILSSQDGQSNRIVNRCVEIYFMCFVMEQPKR